MIDSTCPHCGRPNNAHVAMSPASPNNPHPGDLSVCLGCTGLGIYTATGIRAAHPDEADQLAGSLLRRRRR